MGALSCEWKSKNSPVVEQPRLYRVVAVRRVYGFLWAALHKKCCGYCSIMVVFSVLSFNFLFPYLFKAL